MSFIRSNRLWIGLALCGLIVVLTILPLLSRWKLSAVALAALQGTDCPTASYGWEQLRTCADELHRAVCNAAGLESPQPSGQKPLSELRLTRLVSLACEKDQAIVDRYKSDRSAGNPVLSTDVYYVSEAFDRIGDAQGALELRQAMPRMAVWFVSQAATAIERDGDEAKAIALFAKAEGVWPGYHPEKGHMYQYLCSISARDGRAYVINDPCVFYVALDPSAKTNQMLGQYLYLNRRFPEAVTAFREAIKYDPGKAVAYQWLSQTFSDLGDLSEAAGALSEGIRSAGPDFALYLDYAEVSARRGCYAEADAYARKALMLASTDDDRERAQALLRTLTQRTNAEECK